MEMRHVKQCVLETKIPNFIKSSSIVSGKRQVNFFGNTCTYFDRSTKNGTIPRSNKIEQHKEAIQQSNTTEQ